MRGISGTAAAKALILAAIPVGAVGFLVTDRWAISAIVANLVLLGVGGGLWWWAAPPRRSTSRLRRTLVYLTVVPLKDPDDDDDYDDADDDFGDPGSVVFPSRRVRRHQLTLSTTSRLRRHGMRRSLMGEHAGGDSDLMMMANTLTQIQGGLQSAQRSARREQLWWLVAGLAASIPIGVAINLATG
ncbi:hypothetical protein [Micromonospora foliorum]|uniref:hypothetical protein n=1 Tax=Micromonospora foliorum TaxID=2911210 RepID=UPI001EE880DE|nr:hypothetical protein [Micromonospora foliorum]MCG5435558.1 hypothetical protein [Micromonospora foliorum]